MVCTVQITIAGGYANLKARKGVYELTVNGATFEPEPLEELKETIDGIVKDLTDIKFQLDRVYGPLYELEKGDSNEPV